MVYETKVREGRRMVTESEMIPSHISFSGLNVFWLSLGMCFPPPEKTIIIIIHSYCFSKMWGFQRGRSVHGDSGASAAVGSMAFGLAIKPCVPTSGRRSLGPPHTAGHHRC